MPDKRLTNISRTEETGMTETELFFLWVGLAALTGAALSEGSTLVVLLVVSGLGFILFLGDLGHRLLWEHKERELNA